MPPESHVPTLLGKTVDYPNSYDPAILQPIPRQPARAELGYGAGVPFIGSDIWRAYEVSWLDLRGKPIVALARFEVPADSPCLIESKSFKLYLNSHNQTRYENGDAVATRMRQDLSHAAGAPVRVTLDQDEASMARPGLAELPGTCLDSLEIDVQHYEPAPQLLACRADAAIVEETLVSRLLRSNCPVTGQPDWGSVQIQYHGPALDHAALLRYIISFRNHTGFHEQCAEQIFRDIWTRCQPQALRVYACYTRRGGLDINPWRGSPGSLPPGEARTPRQ